MIRLTKDTTTMSADDCLVILDARRGRYWQLNASGSLSLGLLLEGKSVEETAEHLARDTDVLPDQVRRDIDDLVARLVAAGLAEVAS